MPEFDVIENRDASFCWSRMLSLYDTAVLAHSFGRGGLAESARKQLERMAEGPPQSLCSWEQALGDTERLFIEFHSGSGSHTPDLPAGTVSHQAGLAPGVG